MNERLDRLPADTGDAAASPVVHGLIAAARSARRLQLLRWGAAVVATAGFTGHISAVPEEFPGLGEAAAAVREDLRRAVQRTIALPAHPEPWPETLRGGWREHPRRRAVLELLGRQRLAGETVRALDAALSEGVVTPTCLAGGEIRLSLRRVLRVQLARFEEAAARPFPPSSWEASWSLLLGHVRRMPESPDGGRAGEGRDLTPELLTLTGIEVTTLTLAVALLLEVGGDDGALGT